MPEENKSRLEKLLKLEYQNLKSATKDILSEWRLPILGGLMGGVLAYYLLPDNQDSTSTFYKISIGTGLGFSLVGLIKAFYRYRGSRKK